MRNGRPTPPPSARNRSATPSRVGTNDLEQFAEHCRSWYYMQDDNAGRLMTQTLATLPPSQRAPFSRIQASIRSAYHRSVNARKHAEFQAQLSATVPGGSLLPHNRANPRDKAAQKERHERLERFIRNWCNAGVPGAKPFFEALWGVMRLLVIPEDLGGAGGHRIEWEFDDAVFKEAAGKDFMLEAIDLLKGVLAFEETPSVKMLASSYGHRKDSSLPTIQSRAQSQPLPSNQKVSELPASVQPKRARAPSDPFLDAPQSRSLVSTSIPSPNSAPQFSNGGGDLDEPPTPVAARYGDSPLAKFEDTFDDDDEQYLRVWTSPDLTNPEILLLLDLFPSSVSRRPLPRFPIPQNRHVDIEEGEDETLEGRTIRFGTGTMWVSSKRRGDAWEGDWWTRFVIWWRRLFC